MTHKLNRMLLECIAIGKPPIREGYVSGVIKGDYLKFNSLYHFLMAGYYRLLDDEGKMVIDFWVPGECLVRGIFMDGPESSDA